MNPPYVKKSKHVPCFSSLHYIPLFRRRSKFTFRDTKRHKARYSRPLLNLPSGPVRSQARSLTGTEGRPENTRVPGLRPRVFSLLPTPTPKPQNNRRKMKTGRPHKTESETKDIVKHIRYSPDEWSRVEAKLQQSGRTFSEFVRQATFSANVMPSLDMGQITTLRELKVSLDRVGNNINQIAKSGSMVTDSFSLERYLKELQNCKKEAEELSAILLQIRNTLR